VCVDTHCSCVCVDTVAVCVLIHTVAVCVLIHIVAVRVLVHTVAVCAEPMDGILGMAMRGGAVGNYQTGQCLLLLSVEYSRVV